MDIDTRLDKLTERHEALTQTVELLAIDQRKNAEAIRDIVASVGKLIGTMSGLTERMDDFLTIARNHETRIVRLEGS